MEVAGRLRKTFDLQYKITQSWVRRAEAQPSLWRGLGYGLLMARFSSGPSIHVHTKQILVLSVTVFVTLGGFNRSHVAKLLFLIEEPYWIFILFCCEFTLQSGPQSRQPVWSDSSRISLLILPSLVLDSNRASGQRTQHTTVLLASAVVLEFVRSLWVPVKYWRARNVYFRGFKPREGYKFTRSGVKSENQHLEFCAFLSFQPLVGLLLRTSAVHDG